MLNLTIPSYPFVITFAVAALGWGSTAVGLMAALPHLCNLVQPVLATWLRQRMALHPIMVLTFIFTALPWGLVSALPFLPPSTHDLTFALILGVATLSNSLGGVSWSAAIGELVGRQQARVGLRQGHARGIRQRRQVARRRTRGLPVRQEPGRPAAAQQQFPPPVRVRRTVGRHQPGCGLVEEAPGILRREPARLLQRDRRCVRVRRGMARQRPEPQARQQPTHQTS